MHFPRRSGSSVSSSGFFPRDKCVLVRTLDVCLAEVCHVRSVILVSAPEIASFRKSITIYIDMLQLVKLRDWVRWHVMARHFRVSWDSVDPVFFAILAASAYSCGCFCQYY